MDLTSSQWFRPGGLVVALTGFAVTRLFVAEAVTLDRTLAFVFAGLLPLVVGLALAAYGVALAIGAVSRAFVNTVAAWCLAGTAAMVLVLAVTAADSLLRGEGVAVLSTAPLLVGNVLLGGAVGGTLFGVRSAANRRQQREIRRQANRALLLDRLLRHEVINAVNIILGHTSLLADGERGDERTADATETITEASRRITATIESVGDIIEERETAAGVDLAAVAREEAEAVRSEFPDLDVECSFPGTEVGVVADDRIELVLRELLTNAAEDPATSRLSVEVSANGSEATVAVADDGSGLPDRQRELLASGRFPEYDDPSAGFGLQIVRLLVLQYDGRIAVGEGLGGGGTTVAVTLPRVATESTIARTINVTTSSLYRATAAGLVAGVAMGAFFSLRTDLLPVIGALYDVQDPLVGWVTHLFHSVVFAFVFAAVCSHPVVGERVDDAVGGGVAGVLWGLVLWLFAAGLVMPLWLRAVGVMGPRAMLPNLPRIGLVSHLLWGAVLGVSYVFLEGRQFGRPGD